MFFKYILIILISYSLLNAALPADSLIIPAVIGDTTSGVFDGNAWYSFTLEDSALIDLKVTGNMVRDIFFYQDSVKLGVSSCDGSVYVHDCGPGNYFIEIDTWVTGGTRATVRIDTFSLDYRPPIKIGQTLYSMHNIASSHFYWFEIKELSWVRLNRSLDGSGRDPQMQVTVWSPDTTFALSISTTENFHLATSPNVLDTGIYIVEMKGFNTGTRPYIYDLSVEELNTNEVEDNSTFDSAQQIPFHDTITGTFFGIDTSHYIDSVDWYELTLDEEKLIYLGTSCEYEFYSHEDSLELMSSGTNADILMIGRLSPGSYYTKLTGRNRPYIFFVRDSTPPSIPESTIDSAQLVESITFDKNSEESLDLLEFTHTIDRHHYPQNAAELTSAGVLIEPPISDTTSFLSSFTVSFWFSTTGEPESSYLQALLSIGEVESTGNSSLIVILSKGGYLEFWSESEEEQFIDSVETANFSWHKRWSHFALVVSKETMTLYIDGKDIWQGPVEKINNYTGINIGQKRQTSTSYLYSGKLDDILIFNTALDSAGVNALIDVEMPLNVVYPSQRKTAKSFFHLPAMGDSKYTLSGRKIKGRKFAAQVLIMNNFKGQNSEHGKMLQKIKY